MSAWEIAGVCVAVAIGAAVGAALTLKDALDRYLGGDLEPVWRATA
jgi:hypothetical protein